MKCKIENVKLRIGSLRNFHVWQFLIPLSSFLILCGCIHREFEYAQEDMETAYVDVVFDWANEPTANPETMSLYLFPTDGGTPLRHEFVGSDGGTIRVNTGSYHAICINSDRRDVLYRNQDAHHTFEITTSELASLSLSPAMKVTPLDVPRAPGSEDQPMMNQPPLLWASSEKDFVFESFAAVRGRGRGGNPELRMYPVRIVDTYVIKVKKITNVESLQSLSATISGMSDGYLPSTQSSNDNSAILSVEMTHDADEATARGTFLTFGHCPSGQKTHRLMLYAILNDGSKYYFEFDVSEQAHKDASDDNIHYIEVECIDIPEPAGDDAGSGLSPSVNVWNTIDITIEM